MTEARPPRPTRRLKTWSSLGQLGRIRSEYEIVTHNLNYTTRPNRTSALESNPTSPANMWFLTYRDKSPLQADDWRGFRDPDEITYRKYVTMQDEQETAVERSWMSTALPGTMPRCPSSGWSASRPCSRPPGSRCTHCRCVPPIWDRWHPRLTYPTAPCSGPETCCAGCR